MSRIPTLGLKYANITYFGLFGSMICIGYVFGSRLGAHTVGDHRIYFGIKGPVPSSRYDHSNSKPAFYQRKRNLQLLQGNPNLTLPRSKRPPICRSSHTSKGLVRATLQRAGPRKLPSERCRRRRSQRPGDPPRPAKLRRFVRPCS